MVSSGNVIINLPGNHIGSFRGLTTIVPLKADDEILVNYQMTLARSPEWYRQVWLAWMRKTKKDDAAIQR